MFKPQVMERNSEIDSMIDRNKNIDQVNEENDKAMMSAYLKDVSIISDAQSKSNKNLIVYPND